jgi:hypothetical protein
MKLLRQIVLYIILAVLLYFGVTGVDGAYNVFAAYTIVMAVISLSLHDASIRKHSVKQYLSTNPGKARRAWTRGLMVAYNVTALGVLVWFGKFIIAAFLGVMLLNLEKLWMDINAAFAQAELG